MLEKIEAKGVHACVQYVGLNVFAYIMCQGCTYAGEGISEVWPNFHTFLVVAI